VITRIAIVILADGDVVCAGRAEIGTEPAGDGNSSGVNMPSGV
jgi:hypothetical protein